MMTPPDPVAKIHPATREILPEDPMEMHGFEIPGDPNLMLNLLVEEYARLGWGLQEIMQLACNPNYQAFHGLLRTFGKQELESRVQQTLARCGVMRTRIMEAELPAPPPEVIQLDLNFVR